ncbi:MAG TPA: Ig-like domain-containing protein [Kofleriaceae bacterium]|nr:Ig-like domain-containing protein [Kofleriaceae bacterium]
MVGVGCGDNKKGGDVPVDGSPPGDDAPPIDGAVDASIDAPDIDAPPGVADGIAEARAAGDGTGLNLAIVGVTVTYIKPALGNLTNDPAGFTIQHDQQGPALFVSVDPATLSPALQVGDVVSFTITTMGTVGGQRRAQAIANLTRDAQGANVGALSQNLSTATDVVSAIDTYDSELVTITGTITQDFAASGSGFQRAAVDTAGITGDTNFQLRAPISLVDAIDMVNTCQFTATNVPMGRFNAQAQIGVFSTSDITLTSCPAPVVANAIALSSTSVRITFSRNVLASSVAADGSQFTFDNGLTATAATVNGRTVTVTTSAQAVGTNFTVTVANTVTDLQGSPVATPNTATFGGFVTPAVVRINELNANIGGGCDLIELRVVSGGSMTGYKLTERTGAVASGELSFTFPSFTVATNDIVVVHMGATSATCNPGGATAETASIIGEPSATHAGNFDTAFDFWSPDAGLTATDNVFTLFDAANAIMDAVFVSNDPAGALTAAATETAAATVGQANQWDPALAAYIDTVFRTNAVDDLDATGTAATGSSIQRLDNTDDNNVGDWTTGAGVASTFGLINIGQTPF